MLSMLRSPARRLLGIRFSSNAAPFSKPSEHRVILDGETLYIGHELAKALGWKEEQGVSGRKLTLHGWEPNYFAVTPEGTDSELLARGTVESSKNPNVQQVLELLRER